MRKIMILVAVLLFLSPVVASAQDVLIHAKIQDVRVIVNEERSLQGISYEVGVPVMAFGPQVEKAKALRKGDILKAICDRRESQGKVSYTILKIVK
ncbi:MAG: hypothetical protein JRI90_14585 [Deltaproteobacteria bacterium]|nr:hypothetical protein [Deltaproteobacteria bacterium]